MLHEKELEETSQPLEFTPGKSFYCDITVAFTEFFDGFAGINGPTTVPKSIAQTGLPTSVYFAENDSHEPRRRNGRLENVPALIGVGPDGFVTWSVIVLLFISEVSV